MCIIRLNRKIKGSLSDGSGDVIVSYTSPEIRLQLSDDYFSILNKREGSGSNMKRMSSDYASFFIFPKIKEYGCHFFIHCQGEHVVDSESRKYNTRCVYSVSQLDMKKIDYSYTSIMDILPDMKVYDNIEEGLDPSIKIIKESNSIRKGRPSSDSGKFNLYELLCYCIIKRNKLFIRLHKNGDEYKVNGAKNSTLLKSILSDAVDQLPICLKAQVSIGFSVDNYVTKLMFNENTPLIVAHHDELDKWNVNLSNVVEMDWDNALALKSQISKPGTVACCELIDQISPLADQMNDYADLDCITQIQSLLDDIIKKDNLTDEDYNLIKKAVKCGCTYQIDTLKAKLIAEKQSPIKTKDMLFKVFDSDNKERLSKFENSNEIKGLFNGKTDLLDFIKLCKAVRKNEEFLNKKHLLNLFEDVLMDFASDIVVNWKDKDYYNNYINFLGGNISVSTDYLDKRIRKGLPKIASEDIKTIKRNVKKINGKIHDKDLKNDLKKIEEALDCTPKQETNNTKYNQLNAKTWKTIAISEAVIVVGLIVWLCVVLCPNKQTRNGNEPTNGQHNTIVQDTSNKQTPNSPMQQAEKQNNIVEPVIIEDDKCENEETKIEKPEPYTIDKSSFTTDDLIELSKMCCENPDQQICIGEDVFSLTEKYPKEKVDMICQALGSRKDMKDYHTSVGLFIGGEPKARNYSTNSSIIKDLFGQNKTVNKIAFNTGVPGIRIPKKDYLPFHNDEFKKEYDIEASFEYLLYYFYVIQQIEKIKEDYNLGQYKFVMY